MASPAEVQRLEERVDTLEQSGRYDEAIAVLGELDPDVERELIALREACFASEDMREGVRAFAEKRPARWRGR